MLKAQGITHNLYISTPYPETLQHKNTSGYNKTFFKGKKCLKTPIMTPESTPSNHVTTPDLMTALCAIAIEEQVSN